MARSAGEEDLIVHAVLLKSPGVSLMASDGRPSEPVRFGDSVHLSLTGSDGERITEVFSSRLAEGGKVEMPLACQFWGDTFGMVTDRFGVHWMVNISSRRQE